MAKKKPESASRKTSLVMINFEADPQLDLALDRCVGVERRTRRAILTIALEEYLKKAGLWPPAEEKG